MFFLFEMDELLENDGMTSEGMYVITRTYDSSGNFDRNSDYLVRKYVLYVDRNEVISQPENINEGTTSHSESLVGGEIFVAMYDSGTNTDLVITFPDSPDGNKNSTTLRDNFNLVTNKLPLKIYVPTYKFTQYAKKVPVLAYDEDGEQITTNEYYAGRTRQSAPRAKYWPAPRRCGLFAGETSRSATVLCHLLSRVATRR